MTDEVSPPCGEKESATGDQLFGIGQVTATVQMGRTWVYSQVKLGLFPRPIKLGRASRWSRAPGVRPGEASRWWCSRCISS